MNIKTSYTTEDGHTFKTKSEALMHEGYVTGQKDLVKFIVEHLSTHPDILVRMFSDKSPHEAWRTLKLYEAQLSPDIASVDEYLQKV